MFCRSARVDPEDPPNRAEIDQCRNNQDKTQPSPRRLRTEKHQTDCSRAEHKANDLIRASNILDHAKSLFVSEKTKLQHADGTTYLTFADKTVHGKWKNYCTKNKAVDGAEVISELQEKSRWKISRFCNRSGACVPWRALGLRRRSAIYWIRADSFLPVFRPGKARPDGTVLPDVLPPRLSSTI